MPLSTATAPGRPRQLSGRPCVGADPLKEAAPARGRWGPKFRSAGREESDTISDVVSQSADPIKFWFRSHAWPVLNLRGAHFGQYRRSGAGLFRPWWLEYAGLITKS